jgi:hypothetical protein
MKDIRDALRAAEQRGRTEERAGLIRDARTQHAYFTQRFGHAPEWADLMQMLEDDWLARQRNGEFDDEVAEKAREMLTKAREQIDAEQAAAITDPAWFMGMERAGQIIDALKEK